MIYTKIIFIIVFNYYSSAENPIAPGVAVFENLILFATPTGRPEAGNVK
jgi:hypothetical protein